MNECVSRPGVGVGVYIWKDGKLLLMFKTSKHGENTWSAPGGHLENGESWEACAVRETTEETGIEIENVRFGGVTNDLFSSGKHYVTIAMLADWKAGEPQNLEPEKCSKLGWFTLDELPQPLFLSTRNFLEKGYNSTTL